MASKSQRRKIINHTSKVNEIFLLFHHFSLDVFSWVANITGHKNNGLSSLTTIPVVNVTVPAAVQSESEFRSIGVYGWKDGADHCYLQTFFERLKFS